MHPVILKAIGLPSPLELEAAHEQLRQEILRRERAEVELQRVQLDLADRVRERTAALEEANRALSREVSDRELAVESSPNGMVMIDARGVIVLVNEATERIFGYDRQEMIGQPIEILVPELFRDEDPSDRVQFVREPRIRSMGAGHDLYGLRKDGSEVPVEIGLNLIHTDDGLFVLSAIADITERKQAERSIRAKTLELERSNRDLDEFAHVVSHDLKAPLRGIASLASWIREDSAKLLPAESQEHLSLLIHRAQRMSDLIDGILHYSRVVSATREPTPVDVQAAVEEVVDFLAPPESVRVLVDGPLPVVVYDRIQLLQVFQNLIGNAIQHLGKPSGEILVSGRERPDSFEFAVRDDGVGIDPSQLEGIFKIFQTLNSHPDGGTAGVGLAIVKKIVEKHGGAVSVESTPQVGTTFRFSIPKLPLDGLGREVQHG